MNSLKKKLVLTTAAVVILTLLAVMLVFNILSSRYIESQARSAIAEQALALDSDEPAADSDQEAAWERLLSAPVQARVLYLDEQGRLPGAEEELYVNTSERLIIRYLKEHSLRPGDIHKITIDQAEFFLMQRLVDSGEAGMQEMQVIFANVTPLKNFARTVNQAFLVVLLGAALLAGILGLRMGLRIEDAQGRMKRFFENASHEMKTPLMNIQGYAEGLQTGVMKDDKQALQVILKESDKLNELVEEMLFTARLESGRFPLEQAVFSLRELIYDNVRRMESLADRNHVRFEVVLGEDPFMYKGDEYQLSKVLTNILSNALRYARSLIRLELTQSDSHVSIRLFNDGPPIPRHELPHLFERFFTGTAGQSGIGLYIAREIVELHQGRLSVENLPEGVQFVIELPRRKD